MADAAAAAVDLILARRAWAVVACDDRDDNGKGGDPPALSFHYLVGTVDLHEGVVGRTDLCQVSTPVVVIWCFWVFSKNTVFLVAAYCRNSRTRERD